MGRGSRRKKGNETMELKHFLIILAGGGLTTLVTYLCLILLKFSQVREDAGDERVWQHLLHQGRR
jgi:hypothetical protein